MQDLDDYWIGPAMKDVLDKEYVGPGFLWTEEVVCPEGDARGELLW